MIDDLSTAKGIALGVLLGTCVWVLVLNIFM